METRWWNGTGSLQSIEGIGKKRARGYGIYDYISRGKKKLNANPIYLEGIKVYYFKNLFELSAAKNSISLPIGMIIKIFKTHSDFDIIHLQDCRFIPNVFIVHFALKENIPYVFQPRYSYNTFYQKKFLKKIYDRCYGNKIFKNANKIIAQLPTEGIEFLKMGITKDRIDLIPNGMEVSEFEDLPEKGFFRRKYGINEDIKIILYLGRIDYIKGIDLLIESFYDVQKIYRNVLLVIIGPDAGYLKKAQSQVNNLGLEEHVKFLGPIEGYEKKEAYIDANVFVLPSRHEGFSLAPLEAYLCGVPVITTDRCGTSEWMSKDFDYIVSFNKVELTNAIIKSIMNFSSDKFSKDEHKKRMNYLKKKFSWISICEQIEQIYHEIEKDYSKRKSG